MNNMASYGRVAFVFALVIMTGCMGSPVGNMIQDSHQINVKNINGNNHTVDVKVYSSESKDEVIRSKEEVRGPKNGSISKMMTISGQKHMVVTSDTGETASLTTRSNMSSATIGIQTDGRVLIGVPM